MLEKRIKKALDNANLTVLQASLKSNRYKHKFCFSSVYKWISGERKPDIRALRVLEKVTGCKKGYLTNIVLK